MKKKIVCALLTAVLAATGLGCSGGDAKVSFDESKPWGVYEVCEYDVQKIYVGGSEDVVVAEGTYATTLSTAGEESTLRQHFELQYNDSDDSASIDATGRRVINKGLKDSFDSTVTFYRDSLIPKSAEKKFAIAQRPLCDGDISGIPAPMPARVDNPQENVLYRYVLPKSVRYGDPRGYGYTADYVTNKATITTDSGETVKISDTEYHRDYTESKKEFNISNNTRFDNEQLNFVARALTGMKKKGSATFYLSNFYDSYVKNSYVRHTMSLSCAEKTTAVTLQIDASDITISDTEAPLEADENGKYAVDCLQATVGISSSTPGPAISLLVTDPSITFSPKSDESIKTSKVIVEMTYIEYSMSNATQNFKTVYTLKNYRHN